MGRARTVTRQASNKPTPFVRKTETRVLTFVREHGVIREGEHALVAVSGGGDSTAMLLALARLAAECRWRLTVAHFDHRLRTRREAAEDLAFVAGLCRSLDLPLVHGAGDVARRAKAHGESVEQAARVLRYRFLAREARRAGATVVLLGHTVDDQAETVLLHLARGSGVDGLAGMRPRSSWPLGRGPDAGRPLLRLRREETSRYCREAGITPREDATNELLLATRNRVRQEALPALRRLNPRISEALARLAEAAAGDVSVLDQLAQREFQEAARVERGRVAVDLKRLGEAPAGLRPRILRRAVQALLGSLAGLEAVHVEALLSLAASRPGRASLPRGVVAVRDSRWLTLHRGEPPAGSGIPETPLAVPGITEVGGWRFEVSLAPAGTAAGPGPLQACLDADAVGRFLLVRSRKPGDRMRPLGLGGERKLQDIMVDAKVPREERDGVPLVVTRWGVVWAVGLRVDERAVATDASRGMVRVRATRIGRPSAMWKPGRQLLTRTSVRGIYKSGDRRVP